jgi:hypothetical protein
MKKEDFLSVGFDTIRISVILPWPSRLGETEGIAVRSISIFA